MPSGGKSPAWKKKSFEQLMAEFENIVAELESGRVPLEKSIELFERGMQIAAEGNRRLDEAEKKIQLLLEKDGRVEKVPFQEDKDSQEEDEG